MLQTLYFSIQETIAYLVKIIDSFLSKKVNKYGYFVKNCKVM